MDRSSIALVIPALNESATIVGVVVAAARYGIPIVVDDGSTDNTAELAKKAGGIVVSHLCNQGYDAALNSGFKKALEIGCEVIITLDADGQHDPSLLKKFIDQINAGSDVVFGVRSRFQRFSEHAFSWYTQTRHGIKDPLCGMKAYKANIYRALGHFDSYGSIGTELMLFSVKNKYHFSEVSFVVRERIGKSRFGPIIIGNYKIFRSMLFSFFKIK
jgi:glycosyltransferase involved in cell wall biosynthesis